MRAVIKSFDELKEFRDAEVLDRVGGAARAWAVRENAENILALFADERQAEEFALNIKSLLDLEVLILKELPLNNNNENLTPLLLERGEIIRRWKAAKNILAATPGALMTPCNLTHNKFVLNIGQEYKREDIINWLEDNGYTRVDLVWSPGQYAPRGFIIDIFDPAYAAPRRLEFFDDELESVAAFKSSSQRTFKVKNNLSKSIELHSIFNKDANLKDSLSFMPLDMMSDKTRVIYFDLNKINSQAESFQWLFNELYAEKLNLNTWNEILYKLSSFNALKISSNITPSVRAEFNYEEPPVFKGNLEAFINFCHELNAQDYKIYIYTKNNRINNNLFKDLNLEIINKILSAGFLDKNLKLAFISDREISGITSYEAEAANNNMRTPIEWREQLVPGQLVIHEDYGIGIFKGIETVSSMGSTLDAIILEFADSQRLLVPVLQSHKITPLAEHENENNKSELGSLRGSKWRRKVEKDKERAQEEAKILLEIFAKRELQRRPPLEPIESDKFTKDLYMQFVEAFPYTETSDQIKAINEIMNDLSSPFPMDRLLVGDVGFGKTEVALRAAFRAVVSGYQVCVLVPTTILAQQHYATFQARLAGFPVSVGLLSRFVSKKESDKILAKAQEGKIDIIIGTHKVLMKGVKFKNLGLLIIDEEHRFGVMHKEGLKKIYGAVDILSLSATPIPRTLAMALRGLRSISILSTPPEDRLPVATFTGPWQVSLVRKAVAYELNRGGQVYFLANRISRMQAHKDLLTQFFPESVIKIAHGQMPERELENTMLEFYSGKIDILVATTIIESGLDVGRANTIIIDDAQELGLAQMYQLRGRVGRRGENAFAYFFYPADKNNLKRETVDRLEAISTMTDLGSGYAIAERDLFIRGSGDVSGTSQHGTGSAGGWHIFYKLLEQELDRLRGVEEVKLTSLKVYSTGSIPENYIPQESVRVTMSRRILAAKGLDELNAIANEIKDRFGKLPEQTRLLIAITAIRNFGHNFKIESVELNAKNILLKGNLAQLEDKLKNLNWIVMKTYAKGPGGLAGAEELFKVMRESL
ncbi:MAG: DEAD/DEAH box helicase [Synergistaceae bacterium]|nr:DEAD/DEAH box helicase [Synergistaceae bacterium]